MGRACRGRKKKRKKKERKKERKGERKGRGERGKKRRSGPGLVGLW